MTCMYYIFDYKKKELQQKTKKNRQKQEKNT